MCGLHAYYKQNNKSTDATKFGDGIPLPEDFTINNPVSLFVGITFINTWLNTSEKILRGIVLPIKTIRKNSLNEFLLKNQLLLLNTSRKNVRNF